MAQSISRIFSSNPMYTERERRFIRESFAWFNIPLPAKKETFNTNEDGNLVFIDSAGCTVRIDYKYRLYWQGNRSLVTHDNILQPLGEWQSDRLLIGIYPGIHTPAVKAHNDFDDIYLEQAQKARQLAEKLCPIGIFFGDDYAYNMGYIQQSNQKKDDHEVILDNGAITLSMEALRNPRQYATPVQDRQYGDLRRAFSVAAEKRDRKQINFFWKECIKACDEKRLVAGWKKASDNIEYDDLPDMGRRYDQRFLKALNL